LSDNVKILFTDLLEVEYVRVVPKFSLFVFCGTSSHAGPAYSQAEGRVTRFHMLLKPVGFKKVDTEVFSHHTWCVKAHNLELRASACAKAHEGKAKKAAKAKSKLANLIQFKNKTM